MARLEQLELHVSKKPQNNNNIGLLLWQISCYDTINWIEPCVIAAELWLQKKNIMPF